jgi:hypothetical protein
MYRVQVLGDRETLYLREDRVPRRRLHRRVVADEDKVLSRAEIAIDVRWEQYPIRDAPLGRIERRIPDGMRFFWRNGGVFLPKDAFLRNADVAQLHFSNFL